VVLWKTGGRWGYQDFVNLITKNGKRGKEGRTGVVGGFVQKYCNQSKRKKAKKGGGFCGGSLEGYESKEKEGSPMKGRKDRKTTNSAAVENGTRGGAAFRWKNESASGTTSLGVYGREEEFGRRKNGP